jgi:hypothetical protein
MSWLPAILESTFGALFDSAREARVRDRRRPGWLSGPLVISYYVLPILFLVSFFFSWKLSAIISAMFIASY